MAKYLLFSWEDYEASGGLNDWQSTHATFREAQLALLNLRESQENAQIILVENDDLSLAAEYIKSHFPLNESGQVVIGRQTVNARWLREQENGYIEIDFSAKE